MRPRDFAALALAPEGADPFPDADPRPGFYYVTAVDGPRVCLMAGPYPTHREALALVDGVRGIATDRDGRGHFYAWGTMRSETNKGPGSFQKAKILPEVAP